LIIAVLTYVVMQASKPTKIVMSLIVAFTLLPTTYFIFLRPLCDKPKRGPTAASPEVEMEEHNSFASARTAPYTLQPHHMASPMPQPYHTDTPVLHEYINVNSVNLLDPAGPPTPS
jgi:hypothetical protein